MLYIFADEGQLPKLLQLLTGMEVIPALGYDHTPKLTFGHPIDLGGDFTRNFPLINTCMLTLRLPVLDDYDQFKHNFVNTMEMVTTFTSI